MERLASIVRDYFSGKQTVERYQTHERIAHNLAEDREHRESWLGSIEREKFNLIIAGKILPNMMTGTALALTPINPWYVTIALVSETYRIVSIARTKRSLEAQENYVDTRVKQPTKAERRR